MGLYHRADQEEKDGDLKHLDFILRGQFILRLLCGPCYARLAEGGQKGKGAVSRIESCVGTMT